MNSRRTLILPALFAGLCCTALQAADSDINWNGFVAQGVIWAEDSNYINHSGDPAVSLTELGLNARYALAPDWHLAGQLVYLNSGNRYPEGPRLDYLFLDWSFYNSVNWQANLYLGRVKNQHWLYSSTRDVPFTRPSIVLPQSVYFDSFRDIAVGTDGMALQLRNSGDYGDLTFNLSFGTVVISQQQSQQLLGGQTQGNTDMGHDQKASLYWQSVNSQFSYGLVIQEATFAYRRAGTELLSNAHFTSQRVMLTALYQSEHWQLSTELQQEIVTTDGFFFPQFSQKQFGQGGYVMLQYYWSTALRLFSTIDYSVLDKDDRDGEKLQQMTAGAIPAYFGYQHTFSFGASVDLTSNWRLDAEMHWVKGTGRLAPVIQPDVSNNTSEYWQVLAVQLMYRF